MKTNYTDIAVVLDRSGSMQPIKDDVIGGYNTFLEGQQKVPGECKISLYQFDDIYETVYENKDIKSAPKLTGETFVPRNYTALLDAIGKTINKLGEKYSNLPENDRPEKILFVIYTDGVENASKEFTRNRIFEMITHQKEKYNWVFIFLGANQDAIATAASFGINKNSTMTYGNTSSGNKMAYCSVNSLVSSMRCASPSENLQDLSFSEEDREKQEKEIKKQKL